MRTFKKKLIGVAKFDAGYPSSARYYEPVEITKEQRERMKYDKSGVPILKGTRWYVPDDYDFGHPGAIFEPEKKKEK